MVALSPGLTLIPKTLGKTKEATFAVLLPDPHPPGFPKPAGTGFFISADGWFATAAHVLTEDGTSNGAVRKDVSAMVVQKELNASFKGGGCGGFTLEFLDPVADVALLKADEAQLVTHEWLAELGAFPSLTVASRILDEGEDVYSFGYPLSSFTQAHAGPVHTAQVKLYPRVTSAIVASLVEEAGSSFTTGPPLHYVLDKALNYGNSGGPIVATATGEVHGLCSRFQPVYIRQVHLDGAPAVMIPSLYGVVLNMSHHSVVSALDERGIQHGSLGAT